MAKHAKKSDHTQESKGNDKGRKGEERIMIEKMADYFLEIGGYIYYLNFEGEKEE